VLISHLPQFIGGASLLGNPAGVVKTFRRDLEQLVEDSVSSLRHLDLLELQHTVRTAIRSSFGKVTGALGSACHWLAHALHERTAWVEHSMTIENLPRDATSKEVAQLLSGLELPGAGMRSGAVGAQPADEARVVAEDVSLTTDGDSGTARVQLRLPLFQALAGMAGDTTAVLGLEGAKLRGKVLRVTQNARATHPTNPLQGAVRGLLYGVYHPAAALCR
jgi:hypothetical protein